MGSNNDAYLAGHPQNGVNWEEEHYNEPGSYVNNGGWNEVPLGGVQPLGAPAFDGPAPKQGAKTGGRLGNHLREIYQIAGRNSARAYEDAKPTLQNIRVDLSETMNRVKNNPRVAKGIQKALPKIEAIKHHAQPVVSRGGKLITDLASKAQRSLGIRHNNKANQQGPLPAGLPVPVVPQGAHYPMYEPAVPAYTRLTDEMGPPLHQTNAGPANYH